MRKYLAKILGDAVQLVSNTHNELRFVEYYIWSSIFVRKFDIKKCYLHDLTDQLDAS